MNTKHTRVVVTLFLAVATLTTLGFSAPHRDSPAASIMPDVDTCALGTLSSAAIEMLAFLEEPCRADLVDLVETEIDWYFDSSPAIELLLESAPKRSRTTSVWPADLVDQIETEIDWYFDSSPAIELLLEGVLEQSETQTGQAGPATVFSDPGIYDRVSLVTEDDLGIYGRESLVTEDILGIYGRESLVTESDLGIFGRESLVTEDDLAKSESNAPCDN